MGSKLIGKDTQITIGTVVLVATCLFTAYRGIRNDIREELNTKVDKAVYSAERLIVQAKMDSLEKESLMRFDIICEDIAEIKELLKNK